METHTDLNSRIAKWLGMKDANLYWANENHITEVLDFLHDRNQQKWIEDKLIELGYGINYTYAQMWKKHFYSIVPKSVNETDIHKYFKGESGKSKDLAFISAVEQLIDKENEKT